MLRFNNWRLFLFVDIFLQSEKKKSTDRLSESGDSIIYREIMFHIDFFHFLKTQKVQGALALICLVTVPFVLPLTSVLSLTNNRHYPTTDYECGGTNILFGYIKLITSLWGWARELIRLLQLMLLRVMRSVLRDSAAQDMGIIPPEPWNIWCRI